MSNSGLNVKPYSRFYQGLARNFYSGNTYLDNFLRESVSLEASYGKTYVLLSDNEDCIVGYYNICAGSLDSFNGSVREKMGGAVHINVFALDMKYHGLVQAVTENGVSINLSDFLLADCVERIKEIREQYIGCSFITLCATKEGLSLYKRYGFFPLEEDMVLTIGTEEVKCTSMYYPIDME